MASTPSRQRSSSNCCSRGWSAALSSVKASPRPPLICRSTPIGLSQSPPQSSPAAALPGGSASIWYTRSSWSRPMRQRRWLRWLQGEAWGRRTLLSQRIGGGGGMVPPSCWRVQPKAVALAAAAGAGGWGETPCRRGRCRLRPFAPQCRRRCASAGGGGDGQRFGSAHPAAGRGDPAGAGGGLRGAGAFGPPHPPGDGGLRRGCRRSGPAGDHCRRRRCRPPARHGGGPHPAAGDRCAGAEPGPIRGGFAAFDRADARRHPGRHRGHRQWRQCGSAGGPDLGAGRCRPGPAPGGPPARPA